MIWGIYIAHHLVEYRLLPITIWSNFAHAQRRDVIFGEFIQLRKVWNSAKKKFDAAG